MVTHIEQLFADSQQTSQDYQDGLIALTCAIRDDFYAPPTPLLKQHTIQVFTQIDKRSNDFSAGVYDALHVIMADLDKPSAIDYVYMDRLNIFTRNE